MMKYWGIAIGPQSSSPLISVALRAASLSELSFPKTGGMAEEQRGD